jgi:histidine triad (HIT) family protein
MRDCVFCKIVHGEIPGHKVWEDDEFLAFLDSNPVSEGHTLLIPKKHFDELVDLDFESSSKYLDAVKKLGKLLMSKYDSTGFNVALNNGSAAGQVVNHVHFHLLPRKEGDNKKGIFIG